MLAQSIQPPEPKKFPSDPIEAAVSGHLRTRGYEVLAEAGRGGMGVVYKARQVALNRVVAIKVRLFGPADGAYRSRFRAEAEAMARLQHPNIAQVYDFSDDGVPCIVLEFVDGPNLREFIDDFTDAKTGSHRIPVRFTVSLLHIVAKAVHHAHEQGVIHRDLKPSNILLAARSPGGPWVPKLCDFGVSKSLNYRLDLTRTGQAMGSLPYLSPEQAEGNAKRVGPAADIWTLGVVGYELLTGLRPFHWVGDIRSAQPVPPRDLRPDIPKALERLILRCLEKRPADRHSSADKVARQLNSMLRVRP